MHDMTIATHLSIGCHTWTDLLNERGYIIISRLGVFTLEEMVAKMPVKDTCPHVWEEWVCGTMFCPTCKSTDDTFKHGRLSNNFINRNETHIYNGTF